MYLCLRETILHLDHVVDAKATRHLITLFPFPGPYAPFQGPCLYPGHDVCRCGVFRCVLVQVQVWVKVLGSCSWSHRMSGLVSCVWGVQGAL
jgi:hypothetical protein